MGAGGGVVQYRLPGEVLGVGRLPGEVLGGTGYPGRSWGGAGYPGRSWGEQVTEERRKSDPFASLDPLPTC